MKRWLAMLAIGSYLTALAMGIVGHAMNFGMGSHPVVYYFVWDMFCGWSAHEVRYHLIAEGESGNHYRLSPAPWNTFAPYGDLERAQYDVIGGTHSKIAMNTLRHTDHEPMVRFFLIEEAWPKKYNLPDNIWAARFDEPKDPHSYYWLKTTYDDEGFVLQANRDYISHLMALAITDNPRLKADSIRGQPFFAVDPGHRNNSSTAVGTTTYIGGDTAVPRPSAN